MFDPAKFDLELYNEYLNRGLCQGIGTTDSQMCIEAVICNLVEGDHYDTPECVSPAVRHYLINLNDANWSSPEARAKGLHDLGLAQLGSQDIIYWDTFSQGVHLATIQRTIPELLLSEFPDDAEVAQLSEKYKRLTADEIDWALESIESLLYRQIPTIESASQLWTLLWYTSCKNHKEDVGTTAYFYKELHNLNRKDDKYLIQGANIALQVLKDLKSPGCVLLEDQS